MILRDGAQWLLALTLLLIVVATLRTKARNARRFEALIRHASDLTILIDERGIIQHVSPSFEGVVGIAPADAEGVDLC